MTQDYRMNLNDIKSNSENTSTVSSVSYEIERAKYIGLKNQDIRTQIMKLQSRKKFPSNLEYKTSHLDKTTGLSASVFVDKHTGKLLLEWLEKI